MTSSKLPDFSRRHLLGAGAAIGAAAAGSLAFSATPAQAMGRRITPAGLKSDYLDLANNAHDNMIAYARLAGDISGKPTHGWFAGVVTGVREGEKLQDLFRFEGFSSYRMEPLEDGRGYRRLLREVGFYTDLETGEILEEWKNVYTGETVKTVPVANDPFNSEIRDTFGQPPQYGGLNEADKRPEIPFFLPWEPRGNTMNLDRHIHLYYPSALQPDEWPRESPGKFSRVSEYFLYQIPMADLHNPDLTHVNYTGSWARVTPWLPWMYMDQAQGHIVYQCFMGAVNSIDDISPKLVDYCKTAHGGKYAKYLEAPEKYEEPSLSSLENYAREQTPAPAKSE